MMVFLFILGVAFQTLLTSDLRFGSLQQSEMIAFYLAKSGMEYYSNEGIPVEPVSIPRHDKRRFCIITQDPGTSDVTFKGIVTDPSGKVIAQRIIVAPGGDLGAWYER